MDSLISGGWREAHIGPLEPWVETPSFWKGSDIVIAEGRLFSGCRPSKFGCFA
jgi:hypothetical protein